jgi:hypothetical protein
MTVFSGLRSRLMQGVTEVATSSAWEFGWEALVAIGTLGLALATAVLAWSTRRVAQATQAELSASWRPVLMLVDSTWRDRRPWTAVPGVTYLPGDTRSLVVSDDLVRITIVNVGRGPAIGVTLRLDLSDEHAWLEPDGRAIPAGEPAVFDIRREEKRTFPSGMKGAIRYADLTDTTFVTRFEIAQHGTRGAVVLSQKTGRG